MGELRENKKRETRQRISDVATDLFLAHGFEAVTLDEIAAAAKVSKMTVFNYFARKEDLFLDRQDDLKLVFFADALRARTKGQSVVDTLRALVAGLRKAKHPFARLDRQTAGFWRFVADSPSLEARMRELNDDAEEGLAIALGGQKPDGVSRLAAGMIVLTVRTARQEAIRVYERGGSAKKATATLFSLLDRGWNAVEVLAGVQDEGEKKKLRGPEGQKTPGSNRSLVTSSTR